MRVESAHIKGYRLFEDESISFDDSTTIIVGRNNSGKTSFVELFYKFFGSGKPAKFSVNRYKKQQIHGNNPRNQLPKNCETDLRH